MKSVRRRVTGIDSPSSVDPLRRMKNVYFEQSNGAIICHGHICVKLHRYWLIIKSGYKRIAVAPKFDATALLVSKTLVSFAFAERHWLMRRQRKSSLSWARF